MKTFLIRLAVAAVAIPVLLWVFHRGGWWLHGVVIVLAGISAIEAIALVRKCGIRTDPFLAVIATILTTFLIEADGPLIWGIIVPGVIVLSGVLALRRAAPLETLMSAASTVVVSLWIGIGFGSLLGLRVLSVGGEFTYVREGFQLLIFLFANLWLGDTITTP